MPNPVLIRDWTDSRKVNALDAHAERFFHRLMMRADDYGRFHADPLLLKSALFPLFPSVRDTDISRWTAACVSAGLLRRYVAGNGRTYLEVLNFGQRRKWMKSQHPPPEGQIGLPLVDTAPPKKIKRSRRGVEEKSQAPPVNGKNNGHNRQTWQLLKDEQALTARIRQEAERAQPDADLIASLKHSRAQVRHELKTSSVPSVA